MDVSVIIVSYNASHLLRDCIASILQYTSDIDYEIIVVDNNSQDDSRHMVEKEFPGAILIKNNENAGFGSANNAGFKLAKGKYVLFLNPDTLLLSNAIKDFFSFMERSENADVFACGGKLVQKDLTPNKSYGNFPSVPEIMITGLRLGRVLPSAVMDRISSGVIPKGAAAIEVDYIVGADLFLRRSAVGAGEPFDKDFFLYFEETELCYRLKAKGYRAVILPFVAIVHLEGRSSSDKNYQTYALSQLMYLAKCRGRRSAAFIKRFIMALYLLRYLTTFRKTYIQKYAFYRKLAF
jgi:hypothetical protein